MSAVATPALPSGQQTTLRPCMWCQQMTEPSASGLCLSCASMSAAGSRSF